jgi:hypothetical protein
VDAVAGTAVVFGGEGRGGAFLDDAWAFDMDAGAWRAVTAGASGEA